MTLTSQIVRAGLAACALSASPAMAEDLPFDAPCRLEMEVDGVISWHGPFGRGYEVFAPDETIEVATVSIRHDGGPCRYFLTAAPSEGSDNVLRGPEDSLRFDVLHQPSGPSLLSPDYSGSQFSRLPGQFGAGMGAHDLMLYVTIPPGQFVAGGTYSGQALLRLFRDDPAGPELADQVPIGVVAPVAAVLEVDSTDAGTGSNAMSVDLGDLSAGADRTLDFTVRSNAPVFARFESANRGMLAHQAGAPGIAYRLSVGGVPVDLQNALAAYQLGRPGSNHLPVPVRITVPPHESAAAGNYEDTLTVVFVVDG